MDDQGKTGSQGAMQLLWAFAMKTHTGCLRNKQVLQPS